MIDRIFKNLKYGTCVNINHQMFNPPQSWKNYTYLIDDESISLYSNLVIDGVSSVIHYVSMEHVNRSDILIRNYFTEQSTSAINTKRIFILISVLESYNINSTLMENMYDKIHEEGGVSYYIHSFFNFLHR